MKGPLYPGPVPRTDGLVTVSLTEFTARRLRDLPGIIREGIGLSGGWWAMPGAIGVVLYVDVQPQRSVGAARRATRRDGQG